MILAVQLLVTAAITCCFMFMSVSHVLLSFHSCYAPEIRTLVFFSKSGNIEQESPANATVSARQCRHLANAFKVLQRRFRIKVELSCLRSSKVIDLGANRKLIYTTSY